MTESVSAGWREVYRSLSVPYPDDSASTGEESYRAGLEK